MRVTLALLVGLAVGFGSGWIVFHHSAGDSRADVEARFLKAVRRDRPNADSASCSVREATNGEQYVCTIYGPGQIVGLSNYLITVRGHRLEYRHRPRAPSSAAPAPAGPVAEIPTNVHRDRRGGGAGSWR